MKKEKIIYLSPDEARVIMPDEVENRIHNAAEALKRGETVDFKTPISVVVPFNDDFPDLSISIGCDPRSHAPVWAILSNGAHECDWADATGLADFFGSWALSYMGYTYRVEIVSEREALSEELFERGYDAISDFVGHNYAPDEDKDVVQNRINETYAQMPEEELEKFLAKYGLSTGDNGENQEEDDTVLETVSLLR